MGLHGTCAAGFLVVQSIVLPKRLAFDSEGAQLPPTALPMLDKVARTLEAHPCVRLQDRAQKCLVAVADGVGLVFLDVSARCDGGTALVKVEPAERIPLALRVLS